MHFVVLRCVRKYKLGKFTVLSSEEEIANKKNPLLQHDEMCWVVASTIFYQMSRLLYVTFSFANITIVRYGISSSFLQCLPRFYDPVLTWFIPMWWWQKRLSCIYIYIHIYTYGMNIYIHVYTYTGCHRRNGPNFGRVFPMLNYTDITQNTCVPSWTVIEIMAK